MVRHTHLRGVSACPLVLCPGIIFQASFCKLLKINKAMCLDHQHDQCDLIRVTFIEIYCQLILWHLLWHGVEGENRSLIIMYLSRFKGPVD